MSREIRTLVFFDLEATSLIETSTKYPRIIELFMLAVGRAQFLTPEKPRVLNSLRLAFYPNKPISLNNSHITGKKTNYFFVFNLFIDNICLVCTYLSCVSTLFKFNINIIYFEQSIFFFN